ncbi:BolA/IbaG family iron-sulfur metabolism protein [Gallibacterium anatis]|uniref:BolA n=3 Tax=Gallibacterium anatis TaxID=750 RepID=A0A1A7NRV4_9PAST|nr:BolA/IbaG family iron-sulfur metabolism protein [Gallibacterium anatis]AEC17138.1 transcriptional regulator BolA [Gallibacterium anatis UMN179]KGQ23482.1 BolA [Gallibacterium anatis]KGQ28506.1 BolA [Gallibacterium anatis]KGQ37561.1 BolA [Gallibacterium anatis]KGQ40904.1 BolA [Gallibacterium anatis IPDH697-78]
MNRQQQMTVLLQQELSPLHLEIINESHMHSSGKGDESHFKLIIVSERFQAMRAVMRHRLVYQLLAQQLADGVHALALHLYDPEEWKSLQQVPNSPNCMGVGE